jgi:subtilisin family serine protease
MGVDGRGVRIGIISDSLINLQASVDSGDLPSDLIIVDGQDGSTVPDTVDEGRAMAEIIHDLAPGATLLFHSGIPTSLDMIAAIRALTAADADIIVDDLGFIEPVFEDGPVAQAVQEAIDHGVVYVTAAGNDAMRHYQALYGELDPNGNKPVVNLHGCGGADTTMAITIAPGGFLAAFLQWPEPFDGSAPRADYDLFLFDASGTVEACTLPGLTGSCASIDIQLGGNAPPLEVVFVGNATDSAVTVTVVINRFDGASLPLVLNFIGQIIVQEHNVARGSVFGHPCVRDALAVGAIDVDDPGFDTIESFSSQGPCEIFFPVFDVRTKPDVAGANRVVTSVPGFDTAAPFLGTSAAAPHVAAVAALLIEAAGGPGTRSNTQIANIMRRAALDLDEPGNDNTSGHGAVDAFEAASLLQSATNTAPQSTIDSPTNDVVIVPLTTLTFQGACIDAEENFPLSFAWDFGGAAAPATVQSPFGGAAAPATVQSPGALTFSSPGTFPVSFTCTDAADLSDDTPATHTVTVNHPPQSRIVGLPDDVIIPAGSQVDFAGVCTDAENHLPFRFLWFFGGGADIARSTQQNPHDVRFNTPGQFTVSFTCHDALETADPVPATVRIFVNPSIDRGSTGVGGGCSILPGDQLASLSPLEALGNLLLPLVVIVIVRAGCRLRRNARRREPRCSAPVLAQVRSHKCCRAALATRAFSERGGSADGGC